MDVSFAAPRPADRARVRWQVALRVAAVVLITGIALFVRLRAVALLPTDFDEDDYLRAGQLYAQQLAAGDIGAIINERENYEHPPLTKLAFGAILVAQGPKTYEKPVIALKGSNNGAPAIAAQVRSLRTFNAVAGGLTAGVVALVNPVAGLIVAFNSWHIKYTSQAMLEALPSLFAALTLLLLRQSGRNGGGLWWLAAITLGMTAAGKYLYAVGGFAAIIWMWQRTTDRSPRTALRIGAWASLALIAFYAFDPALWPDPPGRLRDSLLFSTGYATGSQVQNAGFGWAQPFVWLLSAVPGQWTPGVFPLRLDGLIGVIGLVALRRTWRTERLVTLWFCTNLLFLLFWPTKWPQYVLALVVPLALIVGDWLPARISAWRARLHEFRGDRGATRRERRAALPWLLPTLLLFAVIVVYPLLLQLGLAGTDFNVQHVRGGVMSILVGVGRGLLGLAPNAPTIPLYSGTGSAVFLLGWPDLYSILRFNLLWVALTMVGATALGLWLASLLQQRGLRGKTLWRTLFILPWALPEFVGGLVWSTLFDERFGGFNYLLGTNIRWLTDPAPLINVSAAVKPLVNGLNNNYLAPFGSIVGFVADGLSTPKAFWVMVIVGIWIAFPFMMLVATAALRSIPKDVYDAARVDGAHGWQLWRTITWPLIKPYLLAGVLLRGVLLFNAFQIPLTLIYDTRPTNTGTLALIGYNVMRFDSAYSFAAALNTFVLGVVIAVMWLYNRQTRVAEGIDYA